MIREGLGGDVPEYRLLKLKLSSSKYLTALGLE